MARERPARSRRRNRWRAVLFHHLTDGASWRADNPLTAGLGVDMPVREFGRLIDELARRYQVRSIDDVLNEPGGRYSARPPLVICFDDAYASVAHLAAPILRERGLPWTLFLNSAPMDNGALALDNLIAYCFNTGHRATLDQLAGRPIESANDMIRSIVPRLSLARRSELAEQLRLRANIDPARLAQESNLYLTWSDVRALAASGVSIGNHTSEHVHCRVLDDAGINSQIGGNAATISAAIGAPVRTFAYPYGSANDKTDRVTNSLKTDGYLCAFLVRGRHNRFGSDRFSLNRVSLTPGTGWHLTTELEVLPRLREAKAFLRQATGR